jgi:DNA-binding beta-propeller fold protein YncE
MWRAKRADMAEQLSRYWDARESRHARSDTLDDALDPALTETIEQLYAHDDANQPDPHFLTRLETTLMNTAPVPFNLPAITAPAPLTPNGRTGASPRPPWPRVEPRTSEWPCGLLAPLATAALVVLMLAGSFFAFGPRRPGRQDEVPAILSVVIATPATPSAGPVEFLWETRGGPDSPLGNPSHLTVAPDGNIWVADAENNRFQIFAPDGTFLEAWGTPGSGKGEFDFTTVGWGGYDEAAIAFAPDGTFYVTDTGNHRIQKFGPDRRFLTAWGNEGTEPGQFITPIDLVVDGQGRVYVLDSSRNGVPADPETGDVQVFDADGQFLAEWGVHGTEPGQLSGPFGIGLDPDGTLLVAEFDNNRVQRFTPEGELLDGWGKYGSDAGEFIYAMDAAVDAAGRVFVPDYSNHRVQVFDHDGQFLAAWGKYGTDAGQFASALGVAVGGDGTVYVTDGGKRLQAFRVGDLPVTGTAIPAATDAAAGTTPSG